jgi:hypothetical protein
MPSKDIFYYNKKAFLRLDKPRRKKFIKKFIDDIVSQLHDPLLIVDSMLSDNNYPVYYLYSDGSITRCKKVDMDDKHSNYISYEIILPNTFFTFPCKETLFEDTYAIMTLEECYKVKDLMNELLLEI